MILAIIFCLLLLWTLVGWVYLVNVVVNSYREPRAWEVVLCLPAALVLTGIGWIAGKFGYKLDKED